MKQHLMTEDVIDMDAECDDSSEDSDFELSREHLNLETFSSIVQRKEQGHDCESITMLNTSGLDIQIEHLEFEWIPIPSSTVTTTSTSKEHVKLCSNRLVQNDPDDEDECSEALEYDPLQSLMLCSQYPSRINELNQDEESQSDSEDEYELTHSDVQLESCYSLANRKDKEVMDRFKQAEERELMIDKPTYITTKRQTYVLNIEGIIRHIINIIDSEEESPLLELENTLQLTSQQKKLLAQNQSEQYSGCDISRSMQLCLSLQEQETPFFDSSETSILCQSQISDFLKWAAVNQDRI